MDVVDKVNEAINGAPFDEVASALISALMMLVISVHDDPAMQDKLFESIVKLMRDQMQIARVISETGSLPH